MRTLSAAGVGSLLFLMTGIGAPSMQAVASPRPCDERSWVAGTTEWCNGTLVYRDHVYDDYGADLGAAQPPHGTGSNSGAGDVDHREHGQALNSADLRVLRLRLDGRRLHARFELNTLFPSDRTKAAVAVDLDDNPRTGGGSWGIGNLRSRGWDELVVLDKRDAVANVIEGSALLRRRPARRIGLTAVVALGDGTPMNVAFRRDESGSWWEERQAAALAAGDVTAFAREVDTADFGKHLHRPAPAAGPGFYDRVYRSNYALGEGIDPEGVQGETSAIFQYLGPYQPYAIYVPRTPAPRGVQLLLHGSGAAHASAVNLAGLQRMFGERMDRILVSPLGRGSNGWFVDWAARDTFDALADVEAHYRTDRNRVFVSGFSMGGSGTLFLATAFPDRFAGAVSWVGFTGDCLNGTPAAQGRQRPPESETVAGNSAAQRDVCKFGTRGNHLDYLENLRNLPVAYLFGAADELVWVNHAASVLRRTRELGYVNIVWLHTGEHNTFGAFDDWRKESDWTKDRRRVRNPARVTFRTNAFMFMPKVDLMPDGVYWVHGMRPRGGEAGTPAGDMVVDLTSEACRSTEQRTTLEYGAGVDPVPWVSQEAVPIGPVGHKRGTRITGSITNVRELTIDAHGACFRRDARIRWDVAVDGPTVVRFTDGRPSITIRPNR
jgi:acetyl esterase/lipase